MAKVWGKTLVLLFCFLLGFPIVIWANAEASDLSSNVFTDSVYVPKWAKFNYTGSMSVARRYGLKPTMLQNGKVLVAGGISSSCTSAELYDPTSGLWTLTGSMNSCLGNFSLTLLEDGRVLAAGGSSAEIYDPLTGIWNTTGSLKEARNGHSATLLSNGRVLVSGGWSGTYRIGSAELYDPSTGIWTLTDDMVDARYMSTETLLDNGKVLLTGGNTNFEYTELYDPLVNIWFSTGSLKKGRDKNTATLLLDNRVLVTGGINSNLELNSAELYNESTGTWNYTGNMNYPKVGHTASMMGYGQVLVTGGSIEDTPLAIAELYDPGTGIWSMTASMIVARTDHLAIPLNDTQVLIAGGWDSETTPGYNSAEVGTLRPANTFTGTLTLPSGWLTSNTVAVQLLSTTSDASVNAGALSNDDFTWGDWITISPNVTANTNWNVGDDGIDKPIYLLMRDIYDQTATVVSGTVDVDTTAPTASVISLSTYQAAATFPVSWSGTDATSGIEGYDIQFRDGDGAWTDWILGTSDLSDDFSGGDDHTYFFRTRAHDFAGNTSSYSQGDTQTTVDISPPIATSLTINGVALNTTSTNVKLALSGADQTSGVAMMSFSNDGITWSSWQTYTSTADWILLPGDGVKTVNFRLRDAVGNVSESINSSIFLDTAAGNEFGISINNGEQFTNQINVNLNIGAVSFVSEMKLSNDAGFAGAIWEPYDSDKDWMIFELGNYLIPRVVYVKYKDLKGNISATYFDDIILDVTPPTGSISIESNGDNNTSSLGNVTVLLNATDDVSGVGSMQISNNVDFSGAEWEPFATTREWDMNGSLIVFARFRDNAGNVSVTYHSPYLYYLPFVIR